MEVSVAGSEVAILSRSFVYLLEALCIDTGHHGSDIVSLICCSNFIRPSNWNLGTLSEETLGHPSDHAIDLTAFAPSLTMTTTLSPRDSFPCTSLS